MPSRNASSIMLCRYISTNYFGLICQVQRANASSPNQSMKPAGPISKCVPVCLPRRPAAAYLCLVRPMTVLLGLLLTGVVFALASAISGIQSIYTDHTGTVITYWHGYGRLVAVAYHAVLALAFYGIYQQCLSFGS